MKWENLKYWQKTGIIFGITHLFLWFLFIMPMKPVTGENIATMIFGTMEFPTLPILIILDRFNIYIEIYTYRGKLFYLIFGTLSYAILGAIFGFIVDSIVRVTSEKRVSP